MSEKRYMVNEIFYSIQGEGARAGTPNVFVRFTGCNMRCDIKQGPKSPGGFKCDTEFASGTGMTDEEIFEAAQHVGGRCKCVIFTGGEPLLQLDRALVKMFRLDDWYTAIETNGTQSVDGLEIDWVVLSPKVAEHAVALKKVNELRYVRSVGQGIPRPSAEANVKCISPAFTGGKLSSATYAWCEKLVKENPGWQLSIQIHNLLGIR